MSDTKRRLLALALLLGMMFLSAIFALQGILLTSIISHYSLDDSVKGFASSAASLGGVIALASSILLVGRVPKFRLLYAAFFICFAFLGLLYLTPSFAVFIAIWLVLGIGMGYVDMLLSSLMADLYTGRTATKMMCILHMLYGVSSMICPVAFSRMMDGGFPWNGVYLIVSVFGFVLFAYTAIVYRLARSSGKSALKAEEKMSFGDMVSLVKKGSLPWLILAMLFHGLFIGGLNTWISRYISVTLGSGIGDMALTFLFSGVMISRLAIPFMPLSPIRYVRLAGFLAGAVTLIAIPFHSGILMAIAVFLCGLFFGAMIPCMLDIGCASTPESTMLATTLMMLALYLAQVVISPVIGKIETAFGLDYGIALLTVFMCLASAACLRVKEKTTDHT